MKKNIMLHINEFVELIYTVFFKLLHIVYTIYLIYYFFTDAKLPTLNSARLISVGLMLLYINTALLADAIKKK